MKVAVFGPSGMLGRQVMQSLKETGHLPHPVYRPMFDVLDKGSIQRATDGCEATINCAGVIPQRSTDLVEMIRVNAEFPYLLVSVGLPTILVSTDCVFSGRIAKRYLTSHIPDPTNLYGRSKACGEVEASNSCVVRTSFIGCEHGFMRWVLSAGVIAGTTGMTQSIQGYKNALWTGSTVQEVACGLTKLLDDFKPGIVHLSTEEPVNKYDLAVKIVELKKLNIEVKPVYDPVVNRSLKPTHLLPPIDEALAQYRCSGAVA